MTPLILQCTPEEAPTLSSHPYFRALVSYLANVTVSYVKGIILNLCFAVGVLHIFFYNVDYTLLKDM